MPHTDKSPDSHKSKVSTEAALGTLPNWDLADLYAGPS